MYYIHAHIYIHTGHDSSIHFVNFDPTDGSPIVQSIRFSSLPCTTLLYTSERSVIGGGYDFNPLIFQYSNNDNKWNFSRFLEVQKVNDSAAAATGGVSAARALFQNKAARGQDSKTDSDTLWTTHENVITGIQNASSSNNGNVTHVSTSSMDGSIVIWDLFGTSFGLLSI